jgi:hypothetical protein
VPLGIDGGLGPVRHSVGAHALAETPHAAQFLLHLGLIRRAAAVWQQVLAGVLGCLVQGSADAEVLRARELCGDLAWQGSGKLGRPFERMQREKASSWEFTDPPACDEPPELVDDGRPPHAVSGTVTAMAMQEHSVRARLRRGVWRTCFTRGHLSRVWRAG